MSEPRRILVTNDDGVESPGLWKLAEAMSEFGQVMVVAPASDVSGSGTMVTYRRDLNVQTAPERIPGVKTYVIDGTPADCVLVGLRQLKEGWISIVAAGINPGANMGADLFLSGTCGAALMGAFRKVTSIAFSLASELTRDGPAEPRWEAGEAVARMIGRGIEDGAVPEGSFLNVNIPPLPAAEMRGVSATRVAPGGFAHLVERVNEETGKIEREIRLDTRHAHPGTDIRAVMDGYVSISPIDPGLMHEEHASRLRESADSLFAHLVGGSQ